MVEHLLAKEGVEGSNPFFRSNLSELGVTEMLSGDFLVDAMEVLGESGNATDRERELKLRQAQVLTLVELVKELRVVNDNLKAIEGTVELLRKGMGDSVEGRR